MPIKATTVPIKAIPELIKAALVPIKAIPALIKPTPVPIKSHRPGGQQSLSSYDLLFATW